MDTKTIGLAALCAVMVAGCGTTPSSAPAGTETSTTVATMHAQPTTAKVGKRDLVGYEMIKGDLFVPAEGDAKIYPPYQAPVEQVFATVGKRVRKGEQLFQLSFPNAEANLQAAGATLKQAQSDYAVARGKNNAPVLAAQEQLDQARTAEKQARDAAATSGDNSQLQQATQARIAADAALQQARSEVNASTIPYKQALDAATLQFKEARAGAKQSLVRAPIEGTVLSLSVQPGQQIGANAQQPIGEIVDLDALEIKAALTPDQVSRVKERMPVSVTFDKIPDKSYEGTVVGLNTIPVGSSGGPGGVQWQAVISFKNDGGLVKPGVAVLKVGVKTGDAHNVLVVPIGAVQRDSSGKAIVKVLDGKDWKPVVVTTGISDGQFVEIQSGLEEGQTVQVLS